MVNGSNPNNNNIINIPALKDNVFCQGAISPDTGLLPPTHADVGITCSKGHTHGSVLYLEIITPLEIKIVVFKAEECTEVFMYTRNCHHVIDSGRISPRYSWPKCQEDVGSHGCKKERTAPEVV